MIQGTVEAIFIADKKGEKPREVPEARAVAGMGLEGDRYAVEEGTWKGKDLTNEVTLVEAEALEAIEREEGMRLAPGDSRRNIVTRGVALNHLVEREFRVGEVVLRGHRLCEPCGYLEKKTGISGLKKALLHRGGLRASIVQEGTIRQGDPIEEVPAERDSG